MHNLLNVFARPRPTLPMWRARTALTFRNATGAKIVITEFGPAVPSLYSTDSKAGVSQREAIYTYRWHCRGCDQLSSIIDGDGLDQVREGANAHAAKCLATTTSSRVRARLAAHEHARWMRENALQTSPTGTDGPGAPTSGTDYPWATHVDTADEYDRYDQYEYALYALLQTSGELVWRTGGLDEIEADAATMDDGSAKAAHALPYERYQHPQDTPVLRVAHGQFFDGTHNPTGAIMLRDLGFAPAANGPLVFYRADGDRERPAPLSMDPATQARVTDAHQAALRERAGQRLPRGSHRLGRFAYLDNDHELHIAPGTVLAIADELQCGDFGDVVHSPLAGGDLRMARGPVGDGPADTVAWHMAEGLGFGYINDLRGPVAFYRVDDHGRLAEMDDELVTRLQDAHAKARAFAASTPF